jgi:hypothetical protein
MFCREGSADSDPEEAQARSDDGMGTERIRKPLIIMAPAYYPSYFRSRGKKIMSLRPATAKLVRPYFKNKIDKYIHSINMIIYIYIYSIVELFERMGEEGEKKNDRVNNSEIHCICVGRRHNEIHQKLLNNRG